MSEDQASDVMTAPAGDLQLAIRSVPETSAAINQTVRSVFRLFDLPVELQDLVLEYVCVLLLASYQNLHFAHAKSLTTLQLILNSDIKTLAWPANDSKHFSLLSCTATWKLMATMCVVKLLHAL